MQGFSGWSVRSSRKTVPGGCGLCFRLTEAARRSGFLSSDSPRSGPYLRAPNSRHSGPARREIETRPEPLKELHSPLPGYSALIGSSTNYAEISPSQSPIAGSYRECPIIKQFSQTSTKGFQWRPGDGPSVQRPTGGTITHPPVRSSMRRRERRVSRNPQRFASPGAERSERRNLLVRPLSTPEPLESRAFLRSHWKELNPSVPSRNLYALSDAEVEDERRCLHHERPPRFPSGWPDKERIPNDEDRRCLRHSSFSRRMIE